MFIPPSNKVTFELPKFLQNGKALFSLLQGQGTLLCDYSKIEYLVTSQAELNPAVMTTTSSGKAGCT